MPRKTTAPVNVSLNTEVAVLIDTAKTSLSAAIAAGSAARKGFVTAAVAVHHAVAAGATVRDLVVEGDRFGNKDAISRWAVVGMILSKDSLYVDQYDGVGSPAEVLYVIVRRGADAGVGLPQQREVVAACGDSVAAVKALTKVIDKAVAAKKKPATPPAPPAPPADQLEGEGEGEGDEPVQPVPASDTIATLLAAVSGPIAKAVALSQAAPATADEVQQAKALIAALSAIANGKAVRAAAA